MNTNDVQAALYFNPMIGTLAKQVIALEPTESEAGRLAALALLDKIEANYDDVGGREIRQQIEAVVVAVIEGRVDIPDINQEI